MAKIRNFHSFDGCIPTFLLRQTWNLRRGAKFHVYRGNVSPLWGKKNIFGPLSKNNTGMAALRAGLPDKQKKSSHFFVYSRRGTHDYHHTWHGDRGGPSHFCIPITFLIRSVVFADRGYWKFVRKCHQRGKMLITWVFVPRKWPNLKLKSYL